MSTSRISAAAAAALALGLAHAPAANAQAGAPPSVTVNGQPVALEPAPIVRAGRVFVPLRGVFEHLGATVVYQSGQINATAGTHTVSLTIGSTQAEVDGSQQVLDVAPFVIGASTYVPLRFVSQALGATVQYDGTNDVVAIVTQAPPQRVVVTPIPQIRPPAPPYSGPVFRNEEPPADASVGTTRPTISSGFVRPVDPNSLHIQLDGLDITSDATRSPSGFIFAPPSPLQNVPHTVSVEGRFIDGPHFHAQWQFASGTQPPRNFVHIDGLPDGAAVDTTFTVVGRTLPNARVRIYAGAHVGQGPYAFGTGTYVGDTFADGDGRFSQEVTLQTIPGASIGLVVHSTDPATKESSEARRELRARQ